MPTLLEQGRQVRAGLDKVRLANQVRQQLSTIQSRSRDWDTRRNKRALLLAKSGYIESSETDIAGLTQANDAARTLCMTARELLQQNEDIDVLSQDGLWTRLLQAADKANSICEDAIRTSWRALIKELGTIESAISLTARVPATPVNEVPLARYRQVYEQYSALARAETPANAKSAADLHDCVAQLREILSTLTPAPAAVQQFFKAVESGGAALDLLTEEVLAWLKIHDDWTRFVVKTRAVTTWG